MKNVPFQKKCILYYLIIVLDSLCTCHGNVTAAKCGVNFIYSIYRCVASACSQIQHLQQFGQRPYTSDYDTVVTPPGSFVEAPLARIPHKKSLR